MSETESDGRAGPPVPTRAAVRDRLDRVTDPELDRSIVELEYVDAIEIDGDRVTVEFTLPTAWCSPAFAWMMAVDARDEVESLPGVEAARIVLDEHMHAEEINRGVNERLSFAESFPDADGDVAAVRADLDEKARVVRQYDAVEALLEAGFEPATIASLRPVDLERYGSEETDDRSEDVASDGDDTDRLAISVQEGAVVVTVPAAPIDRYLEKARETGVLEESTEPLFRTPDGEPIDPESFDLVHQRGRLAQVNMSSQGGICDGLREARERRFGSETGDPETADD
ncbi:metal-sulfur cluster assembly factor [Halopiger aswanensis]|uniref:Metal-sulfur cluster biosynthetic enzyme n=1 Tax=Halopiger aswanensis TaxID=148449 RepID=A0A3R7DY59_9EURY|nr:iron-sulfur cluster assembly protein [Halopiger aswanensis]RKD93686.1 metal-sulfur cluster biosynthetic enzyme [Halopiger aswanensis]